MPQFLKHRNPDLVEWMDRSDCDKELLFRTYRQFTYINRLLSGWKKIYKKHLKPVLNKIKGNATILDIGCGGGDVLRILNKLCREDGFKVHFTGIDPDQRSIEYVSGLEWPDNIQFKPVFSHTLVNAKQRFDIVISNHVMHHLQEEELINICTDASYLAKKLVIFSDIERTDIGYGLFSIVAPLIFRKSYIVKDGLISIKRSFRKEELQNLIPDDWSVQRQFPFRLLAMHLKNGSDG
jgi:2-polyprenyl-3-methyl-5-hydroxy-6-metoxy-1,4-benzoquinol methylase